jgi:hypothetical protein
MGYSPYTNVNVATAGTHFALGYPDFLGEYRPGFILDREINIDMKVDRLAGDQGPSITR